jgi:APA family basic amino acid/polyamine antiporter
VAQQADLAGRGVFSRPASGLIRVAGSADVFIYNVGLVSVGIAIALNQYYGPSLYPGAGVWLSTLLAALGMLVIATTFYFWSVIFPRSGGVYVSLSRGLSPGFAFVGSLVETVILLYYAAFAASLIVKVGLSSFLATVGVVAGNKTLLDWAASTAEPSGVFWIGTASLVLAGVLLATGTRRYFTVQKALFALAVAGTVVLVAVLLLGSRDTFKANLQELTGLDYAGVIATAKQNGYVTGSFSIGTSIQFLVFPLLPLLGAVQSIGLGGEVKRVRRSQLFGMLGGYVFQGAIGFNSISGITDGSTEASVGASPWFTVLAGILTSNVVLATVIMATFVAWIWFWVPAELAYTTRTMIAWSFDRLAPDRLGHVSERFHTPVVAIGLSTAGAVVFMWLIAYRNIAFLSLIEALVVVWGAAMVAAVLFPRTRRELFQASPAASSRIGGVPVMVVTAVLSLAFFALVLFLLWNDPIAAGPMFTLGHLSREFWIVLGIVVFGVAWFLGTRAYRRRQGIDVDLAFRQIPIE